MKIVLLLALLTVSESSSKSVVGQTGQNAILPCTYNFKYYGALSVCWGRGDLPLSGCNNQLISTDGRKVIEGTRASSRYQLLGRLDEGDVSLTILNVTDSDTGRYGCRVEIPGWFNDDKQHFDLTVETAPQTTTSTEQTTASYAAGHMYIREILPTSSSSIISAESSVEQQQQVDSLQSFIGNTVRVSFIVFIPVLLLTAAYRCLRTNQRLTGG
ncbi:hepatitis A virus cellular receptor 1 homolog [Pagrus major]|uniref:hepatitis A virus cellular receptor 1 homolog n=1 Tax=Pagrus major TaxID=143350 RepID=UPI003CC8A78A